MNHFIELITFKQNRKIMSLSSYRSQEDLFAKRDNLSDNKEKRQRLLKIEQKLQAITIHRQNQAKDQIQQELTKRILNLQVNCTEEIKATETKLRLLREQLSEMRMKQSQMFKKCELSRRTRMNEIKQLQKRVLSICSFESNQRKEIEAIVISSLDEKTNHLLKELLTVKQERIELFNKFEETLEQELPNLHYSINCSSQQLEDQLEDAHREAKGKVILLKQTIEREEKQREKGIKSVMQLLNSVIEQIKNDLDQQRRARQQNKDKLICLFTNAYGKLSHK